MAPRVIASNRAAPFPAPPANGTALAVAPDVLWLRLALPLRLNHVNVYLIEDGDGWFLIDTGPGDAATTALWTKLLDGEPNALLRGRPVTRILATHHHPDHVGAAGLIGTRTGAPLLMSEIEYLIALNILSGDGADAQDNRMAFYRRNGVAGEALAGMSGHVARYRTLVPSLPAAFVPVRAEDRLQVGRRVLRVIETAGHAPAQMILHDAADNLLFVADQVLTRISPNVGVLDRCPDDDPLGRFLASLAQLRAEVPDGGLVLPGHHLPFRHLHDRIGELEAHHAARCTAIRAACMAGKGLTAAELVPVLFPFALDPHQYWFAFSEMLAHLNFMAARGEIEARDSHGRRRWGRIGRPSHGP